MQFVEGNCCLVAIGREVNGICASTYAIGFKLCEKIKR